MIRSRFWSRFNSNKIQCKGDLSIQLDGVILTDALLCILQRCGSI